MQTHRKTAQTIEPQDFLLPDPTQRRRPAPNVVRPALIEDAVFEVVTPSPRQYHRVNDNPPRPGKIAEPELLATIARMCGQLAAATEKRLSTLSPQSFVTLLSSLVLVVFWICGGFSALGASLSGVPAGQLFTLVDTSVDMQDANGMKVALVTGAVRNTSGRIIEAPVLAVVAGSKQDIIGTVRLGVDRIGPGITLPFSGRFKLAGGKSADIAVIPEHR
jgi:hypothetical protein